jgi:hypothetical protein
MVIASPFRASLPPVTVRQYGMVQKQSFLANNSCYYIAKGEEKSNQSISCMFCFLICHFLLVWLSLMADPERVIIVSEFEHDILDDDEYVYFIPFVLVNMN